MTVKAVRVRKIAHVGRFCVACGTCEVVCKLGAISVHQGVRAEVAKNMCVGCGKCIKACPAGVISIRDESDI
jgi:ferredoxin